MSSVSGSTTGLPIDGLITSNQPTAPKASTLDQQLGEDAFLKLLTTQLANQDPLKPMDDTQSIAQLAQFSAVQSTNELKASFTSFQSNFAVMQSAGPDRQGRLGPVQRRQRQRDHGDRHRQVDRDRQRHARVHHGRLERQAAGGRPRPAAAASPPPRSSASADGRPEDRRGADPALHRTRSAARRSGADPAHRRGLVPRRPAHGPRRPRRRSSSPPTRKRGSSRATSGSAPRTWPRWTRWPTKRPPKARSKASS